MKNNKKEWRQKKYESQIQMTQTTHGSIRGVTEQH